MVNLKKHASDVECPFCGASIDVARASELVLADDPKHYGEEHYFPLQCWSCKGCFFGIWKAGKFVGTESS